MHSNPIRPEEGLTSERKKRICGVAIERMTKECESDFQFLEQFRTHGVNNFLAWIRSINKADRLEAALSQTCRQLQLPFGDVECASIPNFERWVRSYQDWPLNSGLDLTWRPRQFAKRVTGLVRERLGPLGGSSQSPIFGEDSPFSIPHIRAGLELNSRVADIVLYQFLKGDKSLFDLSYLSVLGLGPTGWKIHSDAECLKAVEQLPGIIERARDLI